jgi:transglutaminase-like putative cysteine protease
LHYLIEHETELAFTEPVREHQVELRLAPRDEPGQRVLSFAIETEPGGELPEHVDCFGNRVHRLSLVGPHDRLVARVRTEVETRRENPFDWMPLDPERERQELVEQLRTEPRLHELLLHRSASVPDLPTLGDALDLPAADPGASILANAQAAMAWMAERFTYDASTTDVHAPLAAFLDQGAGVCQDFAHLMLAILRGWGVPARYVAGYVDPGTLGEEGHVEATHAWAETWIPGAGWRGLDATSGLVVNDRYVVVAVGRDSRDAAPVRGAFKGPDAGEPPAVRLRVARQDQ